MVMQERGKKEKPAAVKGIDREEDEVQNYIYDEVITTKAPHSVHHGQRYSACQPQMQTTTETDNQQVVEEKQEEIDEQV